MDRADRPGLTDTPGEGLTLKEAEARLTAWAEANAQRDQVVRAALAAGVSKIRIHAITGIARSTINAIAKRDSEDR